MRLDELLRQPQSLPVVPELAAKLILRSSAPPPSGWCWATVTPKPALRWLAESAQPPM